MKRTQKPTQKQPSIVKQALARLSPKSPVHVFHHIPKCGGTSLNRVLDEWFLIIKDYRKGWTTHYTEKVEISRLRSANCLCGHFELDGYYLHQRYPEILNSPHFRLFTFVRDPLALQLSLYRYEKKHQVSVAQTIEEHLLGRPNYIASILPATLTNYQAVIDRYFFVGILEESQASLNLLAQLLGKTTTTMPILNTTPRLPESEREALSEQLLAKFREVNQLDYLIYDYCLDKFRKMQREQGVAVTPQV